MHIVCKLLEPAIVLFRKIQDHISTVEDQEKAFTNLKDELAKVTLDRRFINSTQKREPEIGLASVQRQGTWKLRREDADVLISALNSW